MRMLSKVIEYNLIRPTWETLLRVNAIFSLHATLIPETMFTPTQPFWFYLNPRHDVPDIGIVSTVLQFLTCTGEMSKVLAAPRPIDPYHLLRLFNTFQTYFLNRFKYLQIKAPAEFFFILLSANIYLPWCKEAVSWYKRKKYRQNL